MSTVECEMSTNIILFFFYVINLFNKNLSLGKLIQICCNFFDSLYK